MAHGSVCNCELRAASWLKTERKGHKRVQLQRWYRTDRWMDWRLQEPLHEIFCRFGVKWCVGSDIEKSNATLVMGVISRHTAGTGSLLKCFRLPKRQSHKRELILRNLAYVNFSQITPPDQFWLEAVHGMGLGINKVKLLFCEIWDNHYHAVKQFMFTWCQRTHIAIRSNTFVYTYAYLLTMAKRSTRSKTAFFDKN